MKGEAIDAWYSGKHRRPGGNVQAVTRPDGLPLWAPRPSPATSTRCPPSTAPLPPECRPSPSGYHGAGIGIHIPVKSPGRSQELAPDKQARNFRLCGLRFQGERGFAPLTQR